jgi:hypothetical protein
VDELGKAEVQHLHQAGGRDHHVRGLDVAVDDAGRVGRGEAAGDLHRDPQHFHERQASARQPLPEARSLQALHGDVGASLGVPADVVDGDDAGMVEARGGAGLLDEAPGAAGVRHRLGAQQLDRDHPPEDRVARAVEHAHAALSELVEDLEAAEGLRSQAWSLLFPGESSGASLDAGHARGKASQARWAWRE